jgi:hypothetical protein
MRLAIIARYIIWTIFGALSLAFLIGHIWLGRIATKWEKQYGMYGSDARTFSRYFLLVSIVLSATIVIDLVLHLRIRAMHRARGFSILPSDLKQKED